MSLTVGTAIGAGQTWTITNCTSATITSKPAWMTATGAVSGNDYVFTLTGTPDNSAASFTLSANADNNNVPAGCAPAVTGQSVTSASVIVNCITPVIGSWTSGAVACTTPTIGTTLTPTTAEVGVAFSATIAVSNCTTATVTNLPGWASQSYAQSGSNGTITITGTPAAGNVTAGLALTVDATNNPGGCTSASATGLAGGTLVVTSYNFNTTNLTSGAFDWDFSQSTTTAKLASAIIKVDTDGKIYLNKGAFSASGWLPNTLLPGQTYAAGQGTAQWYNTATPPSNIKWRVVFPGVAVALTGGALAQQMGSISVYTGVTQDTAVTWSPAVAPTPWALDYFQLTGNFDRTGGTGYTSSWVSQGQEVQITAQTTAAASSSQMTWNNFYIEFSVDGVTARAGLQFGNGGGLNFVKSNN